MNSRIEESLQEFDERNFENALNLLEGIEFNDDEIKLVSMIKYVCLMNLNRYDESLRIINSLIEKDPYEVDYWMSKARCHYFAGDMKSAKRALSESERLIDKSNVSNLVCMAQIYKLIGENRQALKYCDMALQIDENSLDALREKSLVASSLKDKEMMNECADKLIEKYGDDVFVLLIPLTLRLFSGNYEGCLELVNSTDCLDDEHVEMIKIGLYNRMSEDLNIKIGLTAPLEMDVDEALDLMFKYHYDGISYGQFKDAEYCIVKDV